MRSGVAKSDPEVPEIKAIDLVGLKCIHGDSPLRLVCQGHKGSEAPRGIPARKRG